MRWSSISIKKLMKQMPIFSTDSLEEATIRRLIKNRNQRHQMHKRKQVLKLKIENKRSCNPDMSKLHLMKSIPKTKNLHVMIDLKAKICLPRRIVMPGRRNEKATHNQVRNSLKKDSQLKRNLQVKTRKENNLKANNQ